MSEPVSNHRLWPTAWSLIRAQQQATALGLVLTFLSIAASLLQPWPLKVILDSILGSVPMPEWLGPFPTTRRQPCGSCVSLYW
jgi:hypothetical protein